MDNGQGIDYGQEGWAGAWMGQNKIKWKNCNRMNNKKIKVEGKKEQQKKP